MGRFLVLKASGTISAESRVDVDDLPEDESARAAELESLRIHILHDLMGKAGAINITTTFEEDEQVNS